MEYERWSGILITINEQEDLSKINVIEKIKEGLNAYPREYQKWEVADFDLNHRFEVEGSRLALLHWAARLGYTDVVDALIDGGVDIEAEDEEGWTPLHWADSREIVNALIDKGADIEATDGW